MNCNHCHSPFQVTDEDRRILNIFDVPDPQLCFDCRLQGKMTFYNRRRLYKRKCDLTGKDIVSVYSPDKPFKVYNVADWYSDKWEPMEYGQDFDFSRPFFEQFETLLSRVPQNALAILGDNENSDYTNDNYKSRNCYLIFDGEQAEDSYYGETFVYLKDCVDFLFLYRSENCYECLSCENAYNLKYSRFSKNCSDSWFLKDCSSCRNCFGCVNLNQKEYYIFNEPHTKEAYEKFMAEFDSGNCQVIQAMKQKAEALYKKYPVKALRGVQNVNVSGDEVNRSKNVFHSFDCIDLEDCRYCTDCLMGGKDCMDVHVWGGGMEQCYNDLLIGVNIRKILCSIYVSHGASEIYYSIWCLQNVQNLFGCVGLRQKQYCILNKQYSKQEYEALLPKIIEHMKKTGEWGEFFPPTISPFAYNETLAQEYFPLSKEEVQQKGWTWSDYEVETRADRMVQAHQLPEHIDDIPDDILNWAIVCEISGKPFKIIPQELKFYRQNQLPVPRRHPDQRHLDRFQLKQPYRLFDRNCDKCQSPIQTSYAPEREERIYCEACYLGEVF